MRKKGQWDHTVFAKGLFSQKVTEKFHFWGKINGRCIRSVLTSARELISGIFPSETDHFLTSSRKVNVNSKKHIQIKNRRTTVYNLQQPTLFCSSKYRTKGYKSQQYFSFIRNAIQPYCVHQPLSLMFEFNQCLLAPCRIIQY